MGLHDVSKYPKVKKMFDIPEDEPILIFRAKDKASMAALTCYANQLVALGADSRFISDFRVQRSEWNQWQHDNEGKMKIPDKPLPEEAEEEEPEPEE